MRRTVTAASLALGLSLPSGARAAPPVTAEMAQILPPLVAALLPAVVNISVLKQQARPDGSTAEGAAEMEATPIKEIGSGFIIDSEGYVLTARHVVDGAYQVSVVLSDRVAYAADVVATNARPDLALLRIRPDRPLQQVRVGDSDALQMGDAVIAVGNPYGLASSVTAGVVSALNRDINETSIDDFIQTDAAINHGNSGGPLFNMRGEVVGLTEQILSPTDTTGSIGLGLAIPINDVMAVAAQLRQYGTFRAGYLGVRLQQLTPEIAGVLGLHDISGGIVSAMVPNGPAARAGVREGDVVLQFGENRTNDIRALLREISYTLPGSERVLRIWRDGQERSLTAKLEKWPPGAGNPAGGDVIPIRGERITSPSLGLRVAALTPEIKTRLKLDDTLAKGVVVLGVPANSVGADVGFARGDVVVRVGDEEVDSPAQVRGLVDAAKAAGHHHILMLVNTQGRPHWLPVPTGER